MGTNIFEKQMFEQLEKRIINVELNDNFKSLLMEPPKTDVRTLRKFLPSAHIELLGILQAECLKEVSNSEKLIWRHFDNSFDVCHLSAASQNNIEIIKLDN